MRVMAMAVLCLAGVWPAQRVTLADRTLPASILRAAEAGPLALGFFLARFGVPVGIITADNPSNPEIFKVDVSTQGSVRLDEAIARFNAGHPDDVATLQDLSLTIERKNLICSHQIDTMTVRPTTVDGDLPKLLLLLSWIASGDPPPIPAGTMSLVRPERGAPPAFPQLHVAATPGTTLRQAFDRAVLENQGGVWIVWQHVSPEGRTGCRSAGYYGDGRTVGASTRDFWTSN